MICKLCGGAGHVKEQSKIIRCFCLLKKDHDRRCEQANIPQAYWQHRLSAIPAYTPATKLIKTRLLQWSADGSPQQILVVAPQASVQILLYLAVKSCLAQSEARATSLDDMVSIFLHDRKSWEKHRDCPVLGIVLGAEYTQTIHKHQFAYLSAYRLEPRFRTIWFSSSTSAILQKRYGAATPWSEVVTVAEEISLEN